MTCGDVARWGGSCAVNLVVEWPDVPVRPHGEDRVGLRGRYKIVHFSHRALDETLTLRPQTDKSEACANSIERTKRSWITDV